MNALKQTLSFQGAEEPKTTVSDCIETMDLSFSRPDEGANAAHTAALLKTAADWLLGHGFCQDGNYFSYTGPLHRRRVVGGSVLGALHLAYEGSGHERCCYVAAIRAIQSLVPGSIAAWNDAPERSKGDAVRLLRRSAVGLKPKTVPAVRRSEVSHTQRVRRPGSRVFGRLGQSLLSA